MNDIEKQKIERFNQIADIVNCHLVAGKNNYKEKLECFDDISKIILDSYKHKQSTNADRIRNMSDEKLAEWIYFMYETESCGEPFRSIYNFNTDEEEGIHDSYEDWLDWLQSDAEQERG